MNSNEFREWSLRAAEWGADYRSTLRERPVRPLVEPGEIFRSIDVSPPEHGETMQAIFTDFERKTLPGMT
ncbi:MAG: aspartate aminotransferase family protein, partial [Mesorhizobium sp.]